MKILIISSIFPNGLQPTKGVFVQQQLAELSKSCKLKVIAPIPWALPYKKVKKLYEFSKVSRKEIINGIETYHPRYLVIPKIGRSLYGLLYFCGIYRTAKSMLRNFQYDVVVAYFAYPDGFASVLLAKLMRKPVVIYVLGSDIKVYAKKGIRRYLTAAALKRANQVIAVCEDLKKELIIMGIDKTKIKVILNGVDTAKFMPMDKNECRQKLNLPLDKLILLFIGNLRVVKGAHILLEAFLKVSKYKGDEVNLYYIGEGEARKMLEKIIVQYNLSSKVKLIGTRKHEEIPLWINACDLFCLPSLSEGNPNVILETMACGKPIVATNAGGIPETIADYKNGIMVNPNNSEQLAEALINSLNRREDTGIIKNHYPINTWHGNALEFEAEIKKLVKS